MRDERCCAILDARREVRSMRKFRLIALFVVLAAMVVSANGAVAGNGSSPKQVTIVSPMTVNYPSPNTGTFTTSGPAATSGLICPSGTVKDTFIKIYERTDGYNVIVRKAFTCEDRSGTFFVYLAAHGQNGTESLMWAVLGGTDKYGSLRGIGDGSTELTNTGGINTYTGFLLG
jgi:hypothetical protein